MQNGFCYNQNMGILYIDKPKGMTSFDVCFKLRKILNTKKIGHTGTLDPNATGVMVILYDNATKANQFLVSSRKEYVATVRLGILTDTLDIDGKIIKQKEEKMPDAELIRKTLAKYLGKSKQLPPLTSAIKVNGKKLYEYQRQGIEVQIPLRDIEVKDIELLDVRDDEFVIRCNVSSGTYIRALTRDILDDLGVIGALSELRRTSIDGIDVKDCQKLEELTGDNLVVHSLYDVIRLYYEVYETDNRKHIIDGKRITIEGYPDQVAICCNKEVLAIYGREGNEYRCLRGLF